MNISETLTDSIMRGQRVSITDLKDHLLSLHGSKFATLLTETEPKMNKTGNPYYGRVRKFTKHNALLNFIYEDSVKRRLVKEGKSEDDFKQGSSWHEPVLVDGKLTPICKHKNRDEFYIKFESRESESEYIYYPESGEPERIDRSRLEPWLRSGGNYNNQGLDDKLVILTVGLGNVRVLRSNNEILTRVA